MRWRLRRHVWRRHRRWHNFARRPVSLDGPSKIGEDGSLAFAFDGGLVQFEIKAGTFAPVLFGRIIDISGSSAGQIPME